MKYFIHRDGLFPVGRNVDKSEQYVVVEDDDNRVGYLFGNGTVHMTAAEMSKFSFTGESVPPDEWKRITEEDVHARLGFPLWEYAELERAFNNIMNRKECSLNCSKQW